MGRYDPLRDYLAQCGSHEVVLSFADIESIIGERLPQSAHKYDAWWANIDDSPFSRHSQAKSWHEAGYKARANRATQTVLFYRDFEADSSSAAIPLIDWNGSGRIDPVDVGISMAAAGLQVEPDAYDDARNVSIPRSIPREPYRRKAGESHHTSTPRPHTIDLVVGDRVHHNKFGDGTVASVVSMATDAIVEVEFDAVGRKKLALRAASRCMTKLCD